MVRDQMKWENLQLISQESTPVQDRKMFLELSDFGLEKRPRQEEQGGKEWQEQEWQPPPFFVPIFEQISCEICCWGFVILMMQQA